MNPVIQLELDPAALAPIFKAAIAEELAKHSFVNNLPIILKRNDLKEILGVGNTKISEIMNRPDFPVCREFGNPVISRDLFLRWVEEHSDWMDKNAAQSKLKRNGVA